MKYTGFCYFTCENPTYGFDAQTRLWALNGAQGNVRLPRYRGEGYLPLHLMYLFPDKECYDQFVEKLKQDRLYGTVRVQAYQELPESAIIAWTDKEDKRLHRKWIKSLKRRKV